MRNSRCLLACITAGLALLSQAVGAQQQNPPAAPGAQGQGVSTPLDLRRIALKNGESVDLGPVYWVINCKSVMTAKPEVEILEGPPEIKVSIKEEMIVPRAAGCTNRVSGGTLMVSASDVKETKIVRLMYRIKYKTKDGDRQTANAYYVGLVP